MFDAGVRYRTPDVRKRTGSAVATTDEVFLSIISSVPNVPVFIGSPLELPVYVGAERCDFQSVFPGMAYRFIEEYFGEAPAAEFFADFGVVNHQQTTLDGYVHFSGFDTVGMQLEFAAIIFVQYQCCRFHAVVLLYVCFFTVHPGVFMGLNVCAISQRYFLICFLVHGNTEHQPLI